MFIKPPLKWAGNKYKILNHIIPLIGNPKTYCEPFGGSLSVALNVRSQEYILNDINKDLYYLYTNIDFDFINECRELFTSENNIRESYDRIRTEFNQSTDPRERALKFVYLNKHCFNGLSRYNSKGEFNVPYGRERKSNKILSANFPEKALLDFIATFKLKKVHFYNTSFNNKDLYSSLGLGDVVYFDPPYFPLTQTSNFTKYCETDFGYSQQVELVSIAEELSSKGIRVIISNHDIVETRNLYNKAQIIPIQVQRNIAAKSSSRKKVNELIAVY